LNVQTRKELNEFRFHFLTSLLRLRQICCHPGLYSPEAENAESAKLNAFTEILEPLMQEGHKVLVFSQFVTMLNILRGVVRQKKSARCRKQKWPWSPTSWARKASPGA